MTNEDEMENNSLKTRANQSEVYKFPTSQIKVARKKELLFELYRR